MHLTKRLVIVNITDEIALAVNTLSGAVDIFDRDAIAKIDALKSGNTLPPNWEESDLCRLMKERKYVFESENDEKVYFDEVHQIHEQQRCRTTPVQIAICPTMACNLDCSYCFQSKESHKDTSVMDLKMVASAFSQINELKKLSDVDSPHRIVLFGGEPLLPSTRHLVADIVARCRDESHNLEIVTNGVHLKDFIKDLSVAGPVLNQIQVTLDGPEKVHDSRRVFRSGKGTYSVITEGIDQALSAGLPVTARVNLDQDNITSVSELAEEFELRGWTLKKGFKCYFVPVTYRHREPPANALTEDQLVLHLQDSFRGEGNLLAKYSVHGMRVLSLVAKALDPTTISFNPGPLFTYCEASGLRYFGFAPDGYIYPCGQAIGDSQASIGRFYPNMELDKNKCAQWAERNVLTISECRNCSIATLCGGGCAYMALRDHGNLRAPSCQNAYETLLQYINIKRSSIIDSMGGEVK